MIDAALASPELCALVADELYRSRRRWQPRRLNGRPPFYTFGGASYLDVADERSLSTYLDGARAERRLRGPATDTLIEMVRAFIEERFDCRAELAADIAAPGYHIFIGAAIPRGDCAVVARDCASCHFDLQYRHIPWPRWYFKADTSKTLSFTLPIRLPKGGAALALWDSITLESFRRHHQFSEIRAVAHATPARTVSYDVGRIFIHTGHELHQIAGIDAQSALDERITLQGHAIWADGSWRIYW